jgi:tRNA threonylcarbamoyladenosine biosynthesis protein TsaE
MKELYTGTYTINDISAVAKRLKGFLDQCAVMTFTGPLGAGKTTLVKELLKQAGITDLITSPTFAYVNHYRDGQGTIYNHFDLYRISNLEGFMAAGFDEYLFAPGSKAIVEWPEPIMPLLAKNSCHVTIDYHQDPDKRIIHIKGS